MEDLVDELADGRLDGFCLATPEVSPWELRGELVLYFGWLESYQQAIGEQAALMTSDFSPVALEEGKSLPFAVAWECHLVGERSSCLRTHLRGSSEIQLLSLAQESSRLCYDFLQFAAEEVP